MGRHPLLVLRIRRHMSASLFTSGTVGLWLRVRLGLTVRNCIDKSTICRCNSALRATCFVSCSDSSRTCAINASRRASEAELEDVQASTGERAGSDADEVGLGAR